MVLTSKLALSLQPAFEELADSARAQGQQRYLKTTEPMYGLVTADLRRLVNVHSLDVLGQSPSEAEILAEVSALWTEAESRDERRAAIFVLTLPRYRRALTPNAMGLVKQIIREGAWWDLVDAVVKVQEHMFGAYPVKSTKLMREWARDNNMWVRRYAIISQLHRKAAVDTELLAECIEANSADREFFIAKAIGWALRDYAHHNPEWVREYVAEHAEELQPLSKREAMRHL